jgi:hypothetical protein
MGLVGGRKYRMPIYDRIRCVLALIFLFSGLASAQNNSIDIAYFLVVICLFAAVGAAVWIRLKPAKAQIEVLGVRYDKEKHKIELTVRNTSDVGYDMRSAIRLATHPASREKQAESEGILEMESANAQASGRKTYQLLCEDDTNHMIDAKKEKTIEYEVLLPREMACLDDAKNVEVHISYGEKNKQQQDTIIEEEFTSDAPYSAEQLLERLNTPGDETVEYHLESGKNIFELAESILEEPGLTGDFENACFQNPEEARHALVDVLDSHLEAKKHPYLRRVGDERKFILKKDHDRIISYVSHLEELSQEIQKADEESIRFHLREGNDFANWIKTSVGDAELAEKIQSIGCDEVEKAKKHLASAIYERIDSLKD